MRRFRPAGDAAILLDAPDDAAALAAAVQSARLAGALGGVLDVIPGAGTVLVVTEPGLADLAEVASAIERLPPVRPSGSALPPVEINVAYDGADLADVARLTGLPVAEVMARHAAAEYTVGWIGFSPGFGYLTGLDRALAAVPRLGTPRVSVPAGSVAIAGGYAAIYPAASPGGWRLLGRTDAPLWDPDRDPPALLTPGRRVRFRAVAADHLAGPPPAPEAAGHAHPAGRHLLVVRPGPHATVQDFGRPGFGALGVSASGAADRASLRLANHLVGNPDTAAGLELTMGRAVLRVAGPGRVAVTGAPAPVWIGTGPAERARHPDHGTAFDVADGEQVTIGAPSTGLRCYLSVSGGIDRPAVLGSRSADVLSGLGGGPLRRGAVLPVGSEPGRRPGRRQASQGPEPTAIPGPDQIMTLRILPGPRLAWFDPGALAALCAALYTVRPESNRAGLRLAGPALARTGHHALAELPSEGMVTGALQVPPDGQPILLLADRPATGGYPVIAVVRTADHGLAAQLRPGQPVRFQIASDAAAAQVRHSGRGMRP